MMKVINNSGDFTLEVFLRDNKLDFFIKDYIDNEAYEGSFEEKNLGRKMQLDQAFQCFYIPHLSMKLQKKNNDFYEFNTDHRFQELIVNVNKIPCYKIEKKKALKSILITIYIQLTNNLNQKTKNFTSALQLFKRRPLTELEIAKKTFSKEQNQLKNALAAIERERMEEKRRMDSIMRQLDHFKNGKAIVQQKVQQKVKQRAKYQTPQGKSQQQKKLQNLVKEQIQKPKIADEQKSQQKNSQKKTQYAKLDAISNRGKQDFLPSYTYKDNLLTTQSSIIYFPFIIPLKQNQTLFKFVVLELRSQVYFGVTNQLNSKQQDLHTKPYSISYCSDGMMYPSQIKTGTIIKDSDFCSVRIHTNSSEIEWLINDKTQKFETIPEHLQKVPLYFFVQILSGTVLYM